MRDNLGKFYFLVVYLYKVINCALDPYITGGDLALYNVYPHSVLLVISCDKTSICGGSVLNQQLVLTAAHCLDTCAEDSNRVDIKYGHEEIKKMNKTRLNKFVNHEDYQRYEVKNDISLVMTEDEIPLNDVVKRVILMRYPPDEKRAYVAGWGLDEFKKRALKLKHTNAKIQSRELCRSKMTIDHDDPRVFCAGPINANGAADRGDSGSALVIKGNIQVGIVSYQLTPYTLVVYTNVSYYLDWIQANSKELYCSY